MIGEPYNDRACLGAITEEVRARVGSAEIQAIARRLGTIKALRAWIRSLPHRTDDGDPADGPKVACDVPQRLRLPTFDPNCVERAALYILIAEAIDALSLRALATIDTPAGRHTYPVEDGLPVVLDTTKPRNALLAGLDLIGEATTGPSNNLTLSSVLSWALLIAEEPADEYADGGQVVDDAAIAADALLAGDAVDRDGLGALLWVLALAEREQARWWPSRVGVIRRVVELVADRARAQLLEDEDDGCWCDAGNELPRDGWRLEWAPRRFVSAVAEPAGRLARPLVKPAIKAALAAYGIPPGLADVAEDGINEVRAGNRARARTESARATNHVGGDELPEGIERR